jgi:hypothetical protein
MMKPQPTIVKVLKAEKVRTALANAVLIEMGVFVPEQTLGVAWFQCSPEGDVRIEIVGAIKRENWKGD